MESKSFPVPSLPAGPVASVEKRASESEESSNPKRPKQSTPPPPQADSKEKEKKAKEKRPAPRPPSELLADQSKESTKNNSRAPSVGSTDISDRPVLTPKSSTSEELLQMQSKQNEDVSSNATVPASEPSNLSVVAVSEKLKQKENHGKPENRTEVAAADDVEELSAKVAMDEINKQERTVIANSVTPANPIVGNGLSTPDETDANATISAITKVLRDNDVPSKHPLGAQVEDKSSNLFVKPQQDSSGRHTDPCQPSFEVNCEGDGSEFRNASDNEEVSNEIASAVPTVKVSSSSRNVSDSDSNAAGATNVSIGGTIFNDEHQCNIMSQPDAVTVVPVSTDQPCGVVHVSNDEVKIITEHTNSIPSLVTVNNGGSVDKRLPSSEAGVSILPSGSDQV